jgi:hypothetical protein
MEVQGRVRRRGVAPPSTLLTRPTATLQEACFSPGKRAGNDTEDTVMEIYALTKCVVERSPSQVVGSLLRRKEGKVRIFDSRCGISGKFGSAHHVDQTQSKQ